MNKKTSQQGFTLLELVVVLVIIGVLAVSGVSIFQKYTSKTHVAEAFQTAGPLKTVILEHYMVYGDVPASRTDAGLTASPSDTQGNFISSADIVSGSVIITFGNNASAEILGKTLAFTPYIDQGGTTTIWVCGTATPPATFELLGSAATGTTTLTNEYLPKVCQ